MQASTTQIIIHEYCKRCDKAMRNDGTEDNPVWVCNNPKCRKYKPPKTKELAKKEEIVGGK